MTLPSAVSPATPTTVAISVATPCVVTWANHNLWPGSAILFFATGTLPTFLTPFIPYYVIGAGFTFGSFQIAATPGGPPINTISPGSGVFSAVAVMFGLPGAIQSVASTAIESNHVLKSSAGALVSIVCNIGAVSGWLMLFDATSAPADGAVTPIWEMPIDSNATNGFGSYSWGSAPLGFLTGCTAVFSSTGFVTKTASATATFMGQVQ